MLPVLRIVSEKHILIKEVIEKIKIQEQYNEEDLRQTVKSGEFLINSRIGWARTYLKKAGLVNQSGRGKPLFITEFGIKLLKQNPDFISNKFLYNQYPAFKQWIDNSNDKIDIKQVNYKYNFINLEQTPDEEILRVYEIFKATTCNELLDNLYQMNPYKFEKLVLDLLVCMGYGKAIETKRSNDEGIDGIINKDVLGLEKIAIQVKRYQVNNKIGRPLLQGFIGSLHNTDLKGLFITTSDFTDEAIEYAKRVNLVILNGKQLTNLMFEYDFGVQTKNLIKIKEIDNDFFDDEQ